MDNNQDMMAALQQNKAALLQLMRSADGQRLLQLLQQQSGEGGLQQAAGAAARGDTSDITRMIARLTSSREGADLVQRINRTMEGEK